MSVSAENARRSPRWNREAVAWIGFYAVILLAWSGVYVLSLATPGVVHSDMAATLPSQSSVLSAGHASFPALLAMWALMALAMMLPTFVPTLRTFRDMSAAGASDGWAAVALVAGYLVVWLLASIIGAGAQTGLSRAGLLSPLGASVSDGLTAVLLLAAGAYQFTTLKKACLAKCRMPLAFFMERWKPGTGHALRMGFDLGVLCLGCCWALMALGFVGGAMNLIWMGAATLFMSLEKLPDLGRWLTRPLGYGLILAGAIMLLRATNLL